MDGKLQRPRGKPGFNWNTLLWVLLIWMGVTFLLQLLSPKAQLRSMAYTEFREMVRQGRVIEITMKGSRISGKMNPAGEENAAGKETGGETETTRSPAESQPGGRSDPPVSFETVRPDVPEPGFIEFLERHDVVVKAESQEGSWLSTVVIALLPWLLILGFFIYASRKFRQRMGGGKGGIFDFAQSKAKRFRPTSSKTTFEDVAGLENAKKELQEVVAYLKDPSPFQKLGGELPKGMLLVGPPGVGKTLMAQAAAGEADVPFFSISGSEFIEMFVGVGASRVRDMFTKAKKEAPAVIFIDELDSIGRVRGTGVGGGHDEREQTLNQILAEMDGFLPHESVVVLAATNRPDVLDPALVRPGRFDRRITLDMPRKTARREILKTHTRDKPVAEDVDLNHLAERTVGFSGADLKNLVNETALLAARQDKEQLETEDFLRARDKILLGIKRDEVIADDEKEMIAYHEAGHALVAELMPEADPLRKVTIIPRGGSLGATEQAPDEERYNMKRSYLLDRIAIMLAGRAAEKIKFDDVSTGAGDDLKKATQLARRMVCQWGMSDEIGPVVFKRGETHPFLGRELAEDKDYSEHTARLIDEEIKRITLGMEKKATEVLKANLDQLDALAAALLEKETLDREDIDEVMKAAETAN
ncbi:MAG: ATP-dependent zinc metalloprotease FtsH [Desulfobacterales bacterium]